VVSLLFLGFASFVLILSDCCWLYLYCLYSWPAGCWVGMQMRR